MEQGKREDKLKEVRVQLGEVYLKSHFLFYIFGISLFIVFPGQSWNQTISNISTGTPVLIGPSPTATMDLAKAPRIFLDKTKYSFGDVEEGPDLVYKLKVYNKGKSDLPVTVWFGNSWDRETISPGSLKSIKVLFRTQGRPGHSTIVVTIRSNDPENPEIKFLLDVMVVREIDVQPSRIYMYGVHFKESRYTPVKILGRPGVSLKVLSVQSVNNVVTVSALNPFLDEKENRSGATFEVTLNGTQPIGPFTDKIIIKTNNAKKAEMEIPVAGEVIKNSSSK